MATFPTTSIQYSEASPSGRTAAVRGNVDMDIGAGAIAKGVQGLGGAMYEVGQKIQVANDAMDLSEVNRQAEEADYKALEELKAIKDPAEQQKFIDNHLKTRGGLAKDKNSRVQNAFTISNNKNTANVRHSLDTAGLSVRAKDAKDKFNFARASALQSGNLAEVHKIDQMALSTEIIGPEEHKVLTDTAESDSILSQGITGIESLNAQDIQAGKDKISNLMTTNKNLTIPQLKQANQYIDLANRKLKKAGDDFVIGIMSQSNKLDEQGDKVSIEDRDKFYHDSLAQIQTPGNGLTAEGARSARDDLKKWYFGNGTFDVEKMDEFNQRIANVNLGNDDPELQKDMLASKARGDFGKGDAAAKKYESYSKRLGSSIMKLHNKTITDVVTEFKAKPMSSDWDERSHQLDFAIRETVTAHPEWSTSQVYEESAKLAASYRTASDEQVRGAMSAMETINWTQNQSDKKIDDIRKLIQGNTSSIKESAWNKKDILEARRIVGDAEAITDDHIQQFENYLVKKLDTVEMISPDGKKYKVPSSEVDKAQSNGWRL